MFSASFACTKCGLDARVEAPTLKRLAQGMLIKALAFHAAPKNTGNGSAHCEHLLVPLDIDVPDEPSRELKIECLLNGCGGRGREVPTVVETTCPLGLVATAVLVFHAGHEGHPIRVRWDDWEIESPRPK